MRRVIFSPQVQRIEPPLPAGDQLAIHKRSENENLPFLAMPDRDLTLSTPASHA